VTFQTKIAVSGVETISNFSFHLNKGTFSTENREEIIKFQTSLGLSGAEAQEKIKEVALVIRDNTGLLIGLSSASKTYFQQIQNNVYAYEGLVLPEYNGHNVEFEMISRTKDYLEDYHPDDTDRKCIAMMLVVQNNITMHGRKQAVWPEGNMLYVGNTPQGHPIRLGYFKRARI
jgi:hypothetical protein